MAMLMMATMMKRRRKVELWAMPLPQCSDTPDWWGHNNIHTAHHENDDDGEEEPEDNHDDGDESLHDSFCIYDHEENVDRDCGYLWYPWLICRSVNSHTTHGDGI